MTTKATTYDSHNCSVHRRPPRTKDSKGGSVDHWESNMIDGPRSTICCNHKRNHDLPAKSTSQGLPHRQTESLSGRSTVPVADCGDGRKPEDVVRPFSQVLFARVRGRKSSLSSHVDSAEPTTLRWKPFEGVRRFRSPILILTNTSKKKERQAVLRAPSTLTESPELGLYTGRAVQSMENELHDFHASPRSLA